MNEQEEPTPAPGADTGVPLPPFEPEVVEPRRSPVEELKSWFRDLKSHVKGAVEEAREASAEKQAEMRDEFRRRAGRHER